jgi:RNA polymerase sigma-70 factor (ECF subfamily)
MTLRDDDFTALVGALRPELHRYCARMAGSVADGEDAVQDAIERAYAARDALSEPGAVRAWIFRIAHNRVIDGTRRHERRVSEPLAEDEDDEPPAAAEDPEAALFREEAVHTAVARFIELAPAQRGCVVLKDVLGYSLEEIGTLLDLTVPAVKAALHRGRTRLHELAESPASPAPRIVTPEIRRYAALFNARDWDGVRALFAEDVRLDLVSRERMQGADQVGKYLGNYARLHDWHFAVGWLDGREVLPVFRSPADETPAYFVELTLQAGKVTVIRDFRYLPYAARDAVFEGVQLAEAT